VVFSGVEVVLDRGPGIVVGLTHLSRSEPTSAVLADRGRGIGVDAGRCNP
jgi:hypothetical protein